jgi:tetratricopeptide (TPR) repeat protein
MESVEAKERKIYLRQEPIRVGVGSTAKPLVVENYYEVMDVDEKTVAVVMIDLADRPFGQPETMARDKLTGFIYCPDYFQKKKDPKTAKAEKHVQIADRHLEKGEYYSAEFEYDQALTLNKDHLKANLGKGKTLFSMGRKEEARSIFNRLSTIKELFSKENKHIFNDFGIELRKTALYDDAISTYEKAVSIDPEDEILYYNLARVYYELKRTDEARAKLGRALEIKPEFNEAKAFLSLLDADRSAGPGLAADPSSPARQKMPDPPSSAA